MVAESTVVACLAFTTCSGMDEDDKLSFHFHPSLPVDADVFAYPVNTSDDCFIRYRWKPDGVSVTSFSPVQEYNGTAEPRVFVPKQRTIKGENVAFISV